MDDDLRAQLTMAARSALIGVIAWSCATIGFFIVWGSIDRDESLAMWLVAVAGGFISALIAFAQVSRLASTRAMLRHLERDDPR